MFASSDCVYFDFGHFRDHRDVLENSDEGQQRKQTSKAKHPGAYESQAKSASDRVGHSVWIELLKAGWSDVAD